MKKRVSISSQIKEHLIQGIRSHLFTNGLPSENQIAKQFNVSRMTARKAFSELVYDGWVERIQGKGTFVKTRELSQGYFKIQPSWKQAKDLNVIYTTNVLELKTISNPPGRITDKLNYNQQIILVRRLHFFDQIPVRYEIRYLRGDLCGGILWENLENNSIHELLTQKYNLPLSRVWQRMTAETMPKKIAALFNEAAGHPVFYVERLTYTNKNPVTYVQYYIRGDLAFEDTFSPDDENSPNLLNLTY
ncbi:MAG: GntR family transcriptional regulator [Desulfobacterales bacterium]|nr:GntR family transcriptional regulator [Desulfobacterales bacterium]